MPNTTTIRPVSLECSDCGECNICSPGPESFGWEARSLERGEAEPQIIEQCTKLFADRWPEDLQVLDVKGLPPGTQWARAESEWVSPPQTSSLPAFEMAPPSPAFEVLCLECGELAAPDSCRCRRG